VGRVSNWQTVAVDLDGTLAQYKGWKGAHIIDPPLPGAVDFVKQLLDEGYDVIVFTTREDLTAVHKWLERHGFPQLVVTNVKRPAIAYVDDRAVRFDGDYAAALEGIRGDVWWQRKEAPSGS